MGYNLWATETKILKSWGRELIRLDLFIAIRDGYYGRINGRSVSANSCGITVHSGTIDLDYGGIVYMVLLILIYFTDLFINSFCL